MTHPGPKKGKVIKISDLAHARILEVAAQERTYIGDAVDLMVFRGIGIDSDRGDVYHRIGRELFDLAGGEASFDAKFEAFRKFVQEYDKGEKDVRENTKGKTGSGGIKSGEVRSGSSSIKADDKRLNDFFSE